MRKVIAIIILIGLGALLIYNPGIYNTKNRVDQQLMDSVIEEDEILRLAQANQGILDLNVKSLQKTPEELLRFNSMIMKVMYSGEVSDEEVEMLMKIQRQYYHDDLLELNPEGLQKLQLLGEVKKAREAEARIVDYRVFSPVYNDKDSNIATVKVSYTPNGRGLVQDIYMRYLLERVKVLADGKETDEDGKKIEYTYLWHIKGWVGMEPGSEIVTN